MPDIRGVLQLGPLVVALTMPALVAGAFGRHGSTASADSGRVAVARPDGALDAAASPTSTAGREMERCEHRAGLTHWPNHRAEKVCEQVTRRVAGQTITNGPSR